MTNRDVAVHDAVADRTPDSARPDARDAEMDAPSDRAVSPPDAEADGPRSGADSGPDAGQPPVDAGSDASAGGTCSSAPNDVWTPLSAANAVQTVWAFGPGDVIGYGTDLRRWDGVVWKAFPVQPPFIPANQINAGILGGTADNDVWLVDLLSGKGITRWNGTNWTTITPTTLPSGSQIRTLWVSGPSDAWIATYSNLSNGDHQPAMSHWNGSSWILVPSPLDTLVGIPFCEFWGSSADDLWFAGRLLSSGAAPTVMLHWNGTAWSDALPPVMSAPDVAVESIWGSSAHDIWAAGSNLTTAEMWHFDGSNWTANSVIAGFAFAAVWGSCPSNFWAISNDQGVWHYDGTAWARVSVPVGVGYPPMSCLTGTGPDDVFVTGSRVPTGSQVAVPTVANWHPGLASCGNDVIDPGEQCDPPNNTTCSESCQLL
jgi:hypothetical protein